MFPLNCNGHSVKRFIRVECNGHCSVGAKNLCCAKPAVIGIETYCLPTSTHYSAAEAVLTLQGQ